MEEVKMMTLSHHNGFIIHALTCFAMFGLIWLVQLVHYPSFHYIPSESFSTFANFHTANISFVVIPLMVFEAITGLLFYLFPGELSLTFVNLNFLGIAIIWASTFLLSVPCHNRLLKGKDAYTINKLIKTNWIRTIVWSLRAIALTYILLK